MAWVRFRSGSFQVNFRFQGKERNFTLGSVSQAEADAKAAHVDYLLMRLKQGLVELPAGVDIVSFVEQDGKAAPAAKAANRRASETLGTLRERYLATHAGAQEEKTLYTTRIHFKHVVTTLGEGEVDELLEIVRNAASHPWIYPMVCTADHTGARRSELIRMVRRRRGFRRGGGHGPREEAGLGAAHDEALAGMLAESDRERPRVSSFKI